MLLTLIIIFFFKSDIDLMSGSIVDVKINDFKEYDLYGELVE